MPNYNIINGIDHIFWINLDRAVARREHMETLLSKINIPNTRISAVNGLDKNLMKDYKDKYGQYMNMQDGDICDPNEIDDDIHAIARILKEKGRNINVITVSNVRYFAATISHMKAIGEAINMKNKKYGYVLILEDDVNENLFDYLQDDLEKVINMAPPFEILQISKSATVSLKDMYTRMNDILTGGFSYVINTNIYKPTYFDYVDGDVIIKNMLDIVEDTVFKYAITYTYKYNFFDCDNVDSYLHPDNLILHKRCFEFHRKEVEKMRDNVGNN